MLRFPAGLVGGEGFAVDASLIQADANRQRSIADQDWRRDRDPARSSRAVREQLATLDDTAWGAPPGCCPEVRLAIRSRSSVDRSSQGTSIFRLLRQYLIDIKFGAIVDVEASRAIRRVEVGAAKTNSTVIEWQLIATVPFERDLELAVIDAHGLHTLVFPCRRVGRRHALNIAIAGAGV
jgi:hypothetical protein